MCSTRQRAPKHYRHPLRFPWKPHCSIEYLKIERDLSTHKNKIFLIMSTKLVLLIYKNFLTWKNIVFEWISQHIFVAKFWKVYSNYDFFFREMAKIKVRKKTQEKSWIVSEMLSVKARHDSRFRRLAVTTISV